MLVNATFILFQYSNSGIELDTLSIEDSEESEEIVIFKSKQC